MDATVRLLTEYSSLGKSKPLTGDCGLSRVAQWIYQLNRESDVAEIRSGDLVLVEKKCLTVSRSAVQQLLKGCRKQQAAAVVFPGNYLFSADILNEIQRLGQEYELAVFQMPAALSERTLLGDILLYLIETQNMNSLNDSLLVDFLTKERQEMNIAVERVESIGFSALSSYQIAIVGKRAQPEDGEELSETYKYAYKIIRERVFGESGRLLYMHWKNLLVMAIELSRPEQTPEAFKQILEAACANARFLCPDIGIRAAMGRVCSPLTVIKRSFDEALFAFNIYDLIERENHSSVVSFDDIGFYRVLRGSHNVNEFRRFYEETTGKIAAYDKENNTEFVKSLELYMENDCDLDKASALLFIHKNTLRYRLLRIESITGKSLKNMRVLADYYTCFKIKAYLGLIDR